MSLVGDDIYLTPGEWYFGSGRHWVHTLLGSCVAIVLWHPQRLIGAMTHCMLPTRPSRQSPNDTAGRFADEVVALLAREALRHGCALGEFQARIYGGMAVLNETEQRALSRIGEANVQATRELLRRRRVPILEQHVGGHLPYRVSLHLADGTIRLSQPTAPALPG